MYRCIGHLISLMKFEVCFLKSTLCCDVQSSVCLLFMTVKLVQSSFVMSQDSLVSFRRQSKHKTFRNLRHTVKIGPAKDQWQCKEDRWSVWRLLLADHCWVIVWPIVLKQWADAGLSSPGHPNTTWVLILSQATVAHKDHLPDTAALHWSLLRPINRAIVRHSGC